jgi:L-ascorbate metabolism protein UlaG (beta-lactamase superfamily)
VAIIGVGAYKPEWFMHPNHVSPSNAVKGFNEMQARIFIPMHYGTFDISDEPVGEPLRLLDILQKENKINGELKPLQPGENFTAF